MTLLSGPGNVSVTLFWAGVTHSRPNSRRYRFWRVAATRWNASGKFEVWRESGFQKTDGRNSIGMALQKLCTSFGSHRSSSRQWWIEPLGMATSIHGPSITVSYDEGGMILDSRLSIISTRDAPDREPTSSTQEVQLWKVFCTPWCPYILIFYLDRQVAGHSPHFPSTLGKKCNFSLVLILPTAMAILFIWYHVTSRRNSPFQSSLDQVLSFDVTRCGCSFYTNPR